METTAILRGVRLSAQKGRLVADQIRGLRVDKALNVLAFSPKKGAKIIKKVLESAIANAEHNDGADVDELKVKTIYLDKATNLRRFTARAKGRGNVILKQTCHIHVTVGDGEIRIGHGTEDPSDRLPPCRQPRLDVEVVREQQALPDDPERGHQGSRVSEEEARARLGRQDHDRAPGQERAHHDPQRAPRRGHRQEGRGHRDAARRTCAR